MDLPEDVRDLVSELSDSLLRALSDDESCRELAARIQARGYELCLVLEAAHEKEGQGDEAWSDEDERFLQAFRIALD